MTRWRRQSKIELSAVDIDVDDFDADFFTQLELASGSASDQAEGCCIEVITVATVQRADVDKPINRDFCSLTEKAKSFDSGNEGIHFLADA